MKGTACPLGQKKNIMKKGKKKLIMCQRNAGGIINNHYRLASEYLIWVGSVPEHFFLPTIRVMTLPCTRISSVYCINSLTDWFQFL